MHACVLALYLWGKRICIEEAMGQKIMTLLCFPLLLNTQNIKYTNLILSSNAKTNKITRSWKIKGDDVSLVISCSKIIKTLPCHYFVKLKVKEVYILNPIGYFWIARRLNSPVNPEHTRFLPRFCKMEIHHPSLQARTKSWVTQWLPVRDGCMQVYHLAALFNKDFFLDSQMFILG